MTFTARRARRAALVAAAAVTILAPGVGAQGVKPRIVIVATGGTIAGAAESTTAAGYKSGAVAVDTLIAAVPQLKKFADVRGVQVASVGSQDMNDEIWVKLAVEVNRLLAQPDVDGVAITHGTDTMEETAFFLNLTAKTDKPIVLVGSMRPSTAVSADGPLNLYNAVAVAADPKAAGRGVLVVMNDWIHGAHSLTKTSTTALQTFMSPVRGLVGVTAYGKNDFFMSPSWKHTTQTEFDITGVTQLPRVDIIFASADMSPDLIDCAVTNGAKGIVIAGVGNGNMNKSSVDAAARAVQKGVVVVRSSRVPTGTVGRNVELDDDKLGFIASDELNPQKARILLALALLNPQRSPQDLQALFSTY